VGNGYAFYENDDSQTTHHYLSSILKEAAVFFSLVLGREIQSTMVTSL
jgi:hypothetical protein